MLVGRRGRLEARTNEKARGWRLRTNQKASRWRCGPTSASQDLVKLCVDWTRVSDLRRAPIRRREVVATFFERLGVRLEMRTNQCLAKDGQHVHLIRRG